MEPIGLKNAQRAIRGHVAPLETIQVPLTEALGHAVAHDVTSRVDSPSVDASLMDGFAVRAEDLTGAGSERPVVLEAVGLAVAGGPSQANLRAGQTVQVTTGAPLPPNADAVVPVEQVWAQDKRIRFGHPVTPGQHILPGGSDVARHQTVAAAGESLTPGLLGLLAAAGHSRVSIVRPPRVALVSTGDEVVAPGAPLTEGKLYASNLTTLNAWCQRLVLRTSCLIVKDRAADTARAVAQVMRWADVAVTGGGAWGSARDTMAPALEALNWRPIFHGVRMRPGKGSGFGLLGGKPVFMLPGAPPANLIGFLQLALPGLRQMAGHRQKTLHAVPATLETDIQSRRRDVTRFVFGRLNCRESGCRFQPLVLTSRLQGIAAADALAMIAEGRADVQAGTPVRVQMLTNPNP